MFLDNLNQNTKSWRNLKFHVKISFFAAITDILNFACDVISVPPENNENFLYNQLISENIEGVVFHEILNVTIPLRKMASAVHFFFIKTIL